MQADGRLDVVVFDYSGVCTPSSGEFIAGKSELIAPLRPQLTSIVDEIRARGWIIVLLSNEFDRSWIDDIDDFPEFDHVLVGSDNRVFKPDRRAFQRVLYVTGCEPEHCLVVDDDIANCRVAQSIGCRAVHFDVTDVPASWSNVLGAGVRAGDDAYGRSALSATRPRSPTSDSIEP